jgi:hypothetical protein
MAKNDPNQELQSELEKLRAELAARPTAQQVKALEEELAARPTVAEFRDVVDQNEQLRLNTPQARSFAETEDVQDRPQGIVPRLSDEPHPRFGKSMGVRLIDPKSLLVKRTTRDGKEFLDDPYLALPAPPEKDEDGQLQPRWHITQVRADHAAELLSCDPKNGGQPTSRIATNEEVAEHLRVHGPGGHGNLGPQALRK